MAWFCSNGDENDTASALVSPYAAELDKQGFTVLPAVMDDAWLVALSERVESLYAQEGSRAGVEVHQEVGTRRLADLVNKGAVFDRVYTHPLVLACMQHVFRRPFKLSSLNARDALPGAGGQPLHVDWNAGFDGRYHVCNSIWLLDDMTAANGATRLVPGSHRSAQMPGGVLADPRAQHPDEIALEAPAGSVCVFNSHVWHGGTRNRSGARRRGLHAYFTACEHPQQLDQAAYLTAATRRRLSPAALRVLGVTADTSHAAG